MIGVGTGILGPGSVAVLEEAISALFQSPGPCIRLFVLIAALNARFLLSLRKEGLFIAGSVSPSIGLKGFNLDSNNYRLVRYCRLCKKRFLICKGEKISPYCKACQKSFARRYEDEGKS
jgi:hypothetical protein